MTGEVKARLYISALCAVFLCFMWPARHFAQTQEESLKVNVDQNDLNALRNYCFTLLHHSDYDAVLQIGTSYLDKAYQMGDYHNHVIYAHIVMGQAYVMKGEGNSAFSNLKQAERNALSARNDSALASIYNGLGLYALNINRNHHAAINHFMAGMQAAERVAYSRLYYILLNNLSGVFYLKQDPVGLRYALEVYEAGKTQKDYYLVYCGAIESGYMYYLHKDYDQALLYCKEAEFMMTQHEFKDEARIYALFGFIYTAMNEYDTALSYFNKAIEHRNSSQTSSVVSALKGIGALSVLKGKYDEALKWLNEALELTETENNPTHREVILKELSSCYEGLGYFSEALRWERIYQAEKDSLFNMERERSINEMRLLYDLQRHENQINQQQIELLEKSKNEQRLFGIILFILLLLAYLFYYSTRKNRFYKIIVQQHKEAVSREKILQKQIHKLRDAQNQSSSGDKYASSSLTEEKKSDLFMALEQLMQEQCVYTDNLLTKEKVATLLNTNRTYLSQAINEQTGQTFTQYINKYRINEAVRMLSDPQNDTPLKAIATDLGFNSKATFYKLFQEVVGMTPAQYKNKV